MSYPPNIPPDIWGYPYPSEYANLIDPVTGGRIGDIAANGQAPPFGWIRGESGTVQPNFAMMAHFQQQIVWPKGVSGYGIDPGRLTTTFAVQERARIEPFIEAGNKAFFRYDYTSAIRSYDYVLLTSSYSSEAHTNKGSALVGLGKWSEALEVAEEGIALEAKGLEPDYVPYNNKALALAGLGQLEDALSVLVYQAIPLDTNTATTRNNKGHVLITMGRYDEAVAPFELALEHEQKSPVVHNNLGVALTELGRYGEARQAFNRELALNPNDELVYVNKADLLIRAGHFRRAQEVLTQALKCDPDGRRLAVAYQADVLMQNGKYSDAVQLLNNAIKEYPNNDAFKFKILSLLGFINHDRFDREGSKIRTKRASSRTFTLIDITL